MWAAPTTTDRDRKQLLRTLIEEVILDVQREHDRATVTIRWNGAAITELAVALPRHQPTIRTDEDTVALLTRLAAHYDDATIAGDPQPPRPPLRDRRAVHHHHRRRAAPLPQHPRHKPPTEPPDGQLLPVGKAADELGVAASTIFRWLQAGFIAGEQDTPAPPWRIRVNDQLRALFVEEAPPATCRSSTRCAPSESRARPCCNVSSAASCKPSTSATDGEKACEYWSQHPKPPCSTPPP